MSDPKQRLQDITRHNLLSTHTFTRTCRYTCTAKAERKRWAILCFVKLLAHFLLLLLCFVVVRLWLFVSFHSNNTHKMQIVRQGTTREGMKQALPHTLSGKIELWFHLNNSLLKWMAINLQAYGLKTKTRHDGWLVTEMNSFFCRLPL